MDIGWCRAEVWLLFLLSTAMLRLSRTLALLDVGDAYQPLCL
jgi:hypothetical protein